MVSQHRKNRQRHSFDVIELLLCVILLCAFVYVAYVMFAKWNPYLINSDIINEVTFREATWEQKSLIPDGFVSGNELQANRPVLIYWLFYALTKNIMLSFRLENLCVLLLQLATVGLLLKKLRLTRRTVLLGTTLWLVWLFGHPNTDVLFRGCDAVANFALTVFITFILRITLYEEREEKAKLGKGKRLAIIAGMAALSALTGYTTVKMAMVLYVPLLLTDVVRLFLTYTNDHEVSRREISAVILDVMLLLVNIIFYGICLALYSDRIYPREIVIVPVSSWLNWSVISAQLESLIYALGYRGGGSLGSISGISFFLGGFVIVMQIYAAFWLVLKCRSEEKREIIDIAGYWFAVTVTVLCVEIFSGEITKPIRYFFVTTILPPVILAYALEAWSRRAKRFDFPAVMGMASCAALFVVTVLSNHAVFAADPPVLVQAANYMRENGYRYVAASYWNASVVTGYTEGEIDAIHGTVSAMDPGRIWLIDRQKYVQERTGEPGILLLTDEEETTVDPYVAYMLQNYTQKVQEFGPYNLYAVQENPFTLILKVHKNGAGLPTDGDFKADKPSTAGFIYQGAEITENGELISKGDEGTILYGPYTQSVPGTYDITLRYQVESSTGTDTGIFDVALDNVQQGAAAIDPQNTEAVLKGVKIEAGHRFETRVWVPQGMIIRIQSIEYSRNETD